MKDEKMEGDENGRQPKWKTTKIIKMEVKKN